MRHEPIAALLDMLTAARRAVERLGQTRETEFAQNTDQQWVLFSQIVLIGEAANRVPREVQADLVDIPWAAIISMRNRVVHGYDSIDWNIVFQTVRHELPTLIDKLESIVGDAPTST